MNRQFFVCILISIVGKLLSQIDFSVRENTKIGTVIGNIYKGSFKYQNNTKLDLIKSDNGGEMYFTLLKETGEFIVKSQIDRDIICEDIKVDECFITLLVDRDTEVLPIRIHIEDINDNAPTFPSSQKTINIQENIPIGTSYSLPAAQDRDTTTNGVSNYSISNFRTVDTRHREHYSEHDKFFRIESISSPQLKVIGNIDREEVTQFIFVLVASDSGHKTGSCTMTVLVTDVNDNSPEWKKESYELRIKECQTQGEILEFDATDRDDPNTGNGRVSYRFSDRTKDKDKISQIFYINGNKLYLSNNRPSELGNSNSITMFINAADGNGRMKETSIKIGIEDCNDHPPVITITNRYGHIQENVKDKVSLTLINVKDNDRGRNGVFDCQLNDSSILNLAKKHSDPTKNLIIYKIETNGEYYFDREKISTYTVEIRCSDQGQPPLTSTQMFSINVVDQNDNSPKFEDKTVVFHIMENNAIGSTVGQVKAADPDNGLNGHVRYQVFGNNDFFTVSNYGEIQSKVKFDREEMENYDFTLLATDGGNPPLNDTMTVKVVIRDMNDCAPVFAEEYIFKVTESNVDVIRNERIGNVKANDKDFGINGSVKYKVVHIKAGASSSPKVSSPQLERLVRISFDGGISIYGMLDREVIPSIQLTIEAYDGGIPRLSTQTTVVIDVIDLNDNAPTFIFPNKFKKYLNISMESDIGVLVGTVTAEDPDQELNGTVNYSIVGADKHQTFPFKMESDGKIVVTSDLRTFSRTKRLPDRCQIKASDFGNPSKSNVATLFFNYYESDQYSTNNDIDRKSSESPNVDSVRKQKGKNKNYNDSGHLNATISDSMMLLYCLAAILFFVFIIVFSVLLYIYCTKAYTTSERYSKKLYKSTNSQMSLNPNMKELQQMTINTGELHEGNSGKNEEGAAVCFLNEDGSSYTHLMMLNNNKYTTMAHSPPSQNNYNPCESSQPEMMYISQSYLDSSVNFNSPFQTSSPHILKTPIKKNSFANTNANTLVNSPQNYSTLHDKLIFNTINRKQSNHRLSTLDKQGSQETPDFCQQQKDFNSPYVTSSFV